MRNSMNAMRNSSLSWNADLTSKQVVSKLVGTCFYWVEIITAPQIQNIQLSYDPIDHRSLHSFYCWDLIYDGSYNDLMTKMILGKS